MTRMRIAREGANTKDGRLIASGALEWREPVAVTGPPSGHSYGDREIIGRATDIRREVDGFITAEIDCAPHGLYPQISVIEAGPIENGLLRTADDRIVLLKGELREVHFGDNPVWDDLGEIE